LWQNLLALTHKEGALYVSGTFQASFQLVCQNLLALNHKEGALYVSGTFQASFQLVWQNFLALTQRRSLNMLQPHFKLFLSLCGKAYKAPSPLNFIATLYPE
ncbi:hypothetical protein LPC27_02805, partial [Paraclostridium bifermentans]|uniref:hypothetical protein n=1 Tax=Paraclostridium bifermentans TaxID=1490 RepID=UPI001F27927C